MSDNFLHSDITSEIIKAFYKVYNELGYGFLERVYENAILIELRNIDLECKPQCSVEVFYQNCKVGQYIADIIVEDSVIVEMKAAESICEEHEAQLINYLRATKIEVGILLNFGKKPQFKRKVFSSEFKNLNLPSSS